MLNAHQTVAALVLEHAECAPVLVRHNIDYCCHGDLSVGAAAAAKGIDVSALVAQLSRAVALRPVEHPGDPRALPTRRLVAHLVARHHAYLRAALPFVSGLAVTVASVHGDRNPKLHPLRAAVEELAAVIVPYLDQEERALFPALAETHPDAPAILRLFGASAREHLVFGEILSAIRALSDGFALPDWACNSYRTFFAELLRLESDVFTQVHLERYVLAPRFGAHPARHDPAAPAVGLLLAEHRRFAQLLGLLERELDVFRDGGEPDYDLLRDLFYYLTNYPDRFHHPAEDRLFGKLAEQAPHARACVNELQALHRFIAASGVRFLGAIESMSAGTIVPRTAIEAPAREYLVHYREHMSLEARELIPLARTHLQPADWRELTAALPANHGAADELARGMYNALHRKIVLAAAT